MSVIVSTQSYVAKRTPKMIRGMIMAVMGVMGCIGSCFYLQIVGLADTKHSYMIFGVISIIDVIMLSFLLLMIKIGKFGAPAYDMDGGSDAEDKSSSRGADEGEGGYADIPQLPEVFDEKILEANEEHEVSTIRTETIKDDVDLMMRSRRSDFFDLKVGSINNKLGDSGDDD